MNLEQLTNTLHRIANNLENNNDLHWSLNESILALPPTTSVDDKKDNVKFQETGILIYLWEVAIKLEKLVELQNYNIGRTTELIKEVIEIPVDGAGLSRY